MKSIKVGTIGYGGAFNMGCYHLQSLARNKGFNPTAVCDIDPKRLETAQTDFPGIQTYTDVGTMLQKSDVELLVVILPHNVHAPVAIQCLNANRHVIIEKPFAITVDECDAMIALAKKKRVLLSTFHNRHWDSNILTIRKQLPKIGRPIRWESFSGGYHKPGKWWRSYKETSGGIIYDWGAHFTEWMLQVMDGEMSEICGYAVKEVWKEFSNEDELKAVIRFKNNTVASHVASNIDMTCKDLIRIIGTKGAIEATHEKVEVFTGEHARTKTSVPLLPPKNDDYYKNIHAHLFHGKSLIITPQLARRVIQVLDYASVSAKNGTAMKAKYA